eukprot:7127256-Karenia_brevis.AAC.1
MWARSANRLADHWAKKGAALHGLTADHFWKVKALGSLAFQAARWSSEVRVQAQPAGSSLGRASSTRWSSEVGQGQPAGSGLDRVRKGGVKRRSTPTSKGRKRRRVEPGEAPG